VAVYEQQPVSAPSPECQQVAEQLERLDVDLGELAWVFPPLDDIHWADAPSADFVSYLLRRQLLRIAVLTPVALAVLFGRDARRQRRR
jgi:hypothetical protein